MKWRKLRHSHTAATCQSDHSLLQLLKCGLGFLNFFLKNLLKTNVKKQYEVVVEVVVVVVVVVMTLGKNICTKLIWGQYG